MSYSPHPLAAGTVRNAENMESLPGIHRMLDSYLSSLFYNLCGINSYLILGHVKVVKYLVKKVTQFPSDQECYHYIQSIKDKDPELRMRCAQCVETIITAKERQEKKANEHADELLREIEEEKINLRNKKKSKTKQKKKTKPENESGEIEPGQAEPEPAAPVVQPAPVPEPAEIKTPQTKNRKNKKTNRLEETSTNESRKPDNSTSPTSFASEPARVPVINDEDPADKALRAQMEQIKLEHPEKVEPTSIAAKRTAKDAKRKEKETKRNSKTPNETLEFVNSNIPASVGGALATPAAAVAAQVTIQEEQPDWNVVKNKKPIRKLVLPSNQIARVIGRSGCNVNAIRDVTGTHIGNGFKNPQ